MDYKINKLTLKNFKGSTKLEVRFGDKVSYLIGINGSGKTMIGNAIQYLFEGKTFFNKKYRRNIITDGEDKMKVTGEFVNSETGRSIIISQSLTAKDNQNLKIESGDDKTLGMNDIMDMINMLYLRPFDIINKTPQKQARYLGVDTSKHDEIIKQKKSSLVTPRAELNIVKTKLKGYQFEPEKIDEPKPIADLYTERDNIIDFNNDQDEAAKNIFNMEHSEAIMMDNIVNLKNQIADGEYKLGFIAENIKDLPAVEEKKQLDDIVEKLTNATAIQEKYNKYKIWSDLKTDLATKETAFSVKEKTVIDAEQDKIDYIKTCKVAPSITFDDEGGLLITAFGQKEVYLREEFFSRGQILKIAIQFCVTKIHKDKQNGKDTIPVIFIDNAESLDKKNLEFIHDISEKFKVQFIVACQDDKPKKGKSCIMLTEKSIKKYEEK